MATIRSASHVKSCPRCYRPIASGAPIEVFTTDPVTGSLRYAHLGCKKPVIKAAPVEDEDDNDVDDDEDEGNDGATSKPSVAPVDMDRIVSLVGRAILDSGVRIKGETDTQIKEKFSGLAEA